MASINWQATQHGSLDDATALMGHSVNICSTSQITAHFSTYYLFICFTISHRSVSRTTPISQTCLTSSRAGGVLSDSISFMRVHQYPVKPLRAPESCWCYRKPWDSTSKSQLAGCQGRGPVSENIKHASFALFRLWAWTLMPSNSGYNLKTLSIEQRIQRINAEGLPWQHSRSVPLPLFCQQMPRTDKDLGWVQWVILPCTIKCVLTHVLEQLSSTPSTSRKPASQSQHEGSFGSKARLTLLHLVLRYSTTMLIRLL